MSRYLANLQTFCGVNQCRVCNFCCLSFYRYFIKFIRTVSKTLLIVSILINRSFTMSIDELAYFESYPVTNSHSFIHSFIHSLVRSLTHSLTHSLAHSPTPPLTHPHTPNHLLARSLAHSLIHSFIHSFIHTHTHSLAHSPTHSPTFARSIACSVIHSFIHSFTHSLTHLLTHSRTYFRLVFRFRYKDLFLFCSVLLYSGSDTVHIKLFFHATIHLAILSYRDSFSQSVSP